MASTVRESKRGLTRGTTLTQRVVDDVRGRIGSGELGIADVLLSERELAERHGVSRVTARRALRILVRDGYLVSLPRQGYRLVSGSKKPVSRQLIALVRGGSEAGPWEWSEYVVRLWEACHRAAVETGRDLWALSADDRSNRDIARHVTERGVAGAIVTGDDLGVARALRDEKVAVVLVDAAHPEIHSVTVDFFGGAYGLTERLIKRGRRRLACLCFDSYGTRGTVQVRERLGGFLAAASCAGLSVPPEWVLFADQVSSPGKRLVELASMKGGPDGAVVLWPQLLDDVGGALAGSQVRMDLAAWWGAAPERRRDWAASFPGLPVPEGVRWEVMALARKALEMLGSACASAEMQPGRTLVPVEHVPGSRRKET